jgi:hypothetical protein
MKLQTFTLCLLALSLSACGMSNKQKAALAEQAAASDSAIQAASANPTPNKLKMPEIPDLIQDPDSRMNFLAQQFWMYYDFNDTTLIKKPEYAEQAFVDYINLMGMLPTKQAATLMTSFVKHTEVNRKVFDYFMDLTEKYLYDPNSPMRNEELYIPVLDAIIDAPILSDAEKLRPKDRRELAEKNRPGTRALNFTYNLKDGGTSTLYDLKAPYTLLFINNPGCHACRETIDALKAARTIIELEQSGKLKILSVYPDEDRTEWVKYIDEFPENWIRAYDKKLTIKSKNLYDLKAIPTLYLLDSYKMVILKDTTVPAIEQYLSHQN